MNEWIKINNRIIEVRGLLLVKDRAIIANIIETEKDVILAILQIEIHLLREDYIIVERKGVEQHV